MRLSHIRRIFISLENKLQFAFMNTGKSYDRWASQYDTNENKTRDLEAIALRESLANVEFNNCLEMGCGTGKNTIWLLQKAKRVMAVDFSKEMLAHAKEKI